MLSRRSFSLSKYLFDDDFFDYSIAACAFDFFGSSTEGSKYLLVLVSAGFAGSAFGFDLGASSQSSSKLLVTVLFFSG